MNNTILVNIKRTAYFDVPVLITTSEDMYNLMKLKDSNDPDAQEYFKRKAIDIYKETMYNEVPFEKINMTKDCEIFIDKGDSDDKVITTK